jgi:hypothetical protein
MVVPTVLMKAVPMVDLKVAYWGHMTVMHLANRLVVGTAETTAVRSEHRLVALKASQTAAPTVDY